MTDANLLLGYLGSGLAGGIEPDRGAAERAVGALARELGMDLDAAAQGIVDVANAEMVRALRVMTVERGVDPRELVLLPFGGAGPLHAAAIAEALEMTTILCPRASGVLAALGLVVSDRRRDVQRTVMLSDPDAGDVRRAVAGLGRADRVAYDLRYRGQAYELTVEADPDDLREAFEAAHERAYGYREPAAPVELVTVRVTASDPGPHVDADPGGRGVERATRTTVFGETTVLRGEPVEGDVVEGPAIVELPESTLVVPPGWHGEVEAAGTVRLWTR